MPTSIYSGKQLKDIKIIFILSEKIISNQSTFVSDKNNQYAMQ